MVSLSYADELPGSNDRMHVYIHTSSGTAIALSVACPVADEGVVLRFWLNEASVDTADCSHGFVRVDALVVSGRK